MFPFYLAIGMSADEYWHQDVWLAKAYWKAHKLRNEIDSQRAWLQGLYIEDAVAVAIANAFRKEGAPPYKYRENPIRLYEPALTEEEKAEQIREKVAAQFTKLAKEWQAQHEQMSEGANDA